MSKNYLGPYELADEVINLGIKKGNTKGIKVFLLGILAGIFIGLAYVGYMTATQVLMTTDSGMGKFVGAMIFPVGIMLVLFVGGSLFTGNNLITMAWLDKKITLAQVGKNWLFVWLGNLVGSVLTAITVVAAGSFHGDKIIALATGIAHHKVELTFSQAVLSGILCNILVALGVWMTFAGKDLISKIFACWFPIMLFALSGYQHSVANMFVLSLGKILNPEMYTVKEMFVTNILPVSLGNAIAGGVLIPVVYYYLYKGAGVKKKAVAATAK